VFTARPQAAVRMNLRADPNSLVSGNLAPQVVIRPIWQGILLILETTDQQMAASTIE
jgi:hypothetical protein